MPSLGGTGDEQLLFICTLAGVCVWSAVVVALNILRRRTSIFGVSGVVWRSMCRYEVTSK